jgi:hypothetical protein
MLPLAPGANGAPAEAADRGVELDDPGLDGGQRVGLAGAPGVVEVHADGDARARAADRVEQLHDPQRGGAPMVSPRQSWSAPAVTAARATSTVRPDRRAPVEGAVPGRRDDDLEGASGPRARPAISPTAPTASAVDRPALARLWPSEAETTYSRFATPRPPPWWPPEGVGHQRPTSARRPSGTARGQPRRRQRARNRLRRDEGGRPRSGGRRSATSASSISNLASRGHRLLELQAVPHADSRTSTSVGSTSSNSDTGSPRVGGVGGLLHPPSQTGWANMRPGTVPMPEES